MSNHWYPNGCGVSVDTMDGQLDLSDVAWQQIAPCGCVSGLMVAASADELTVTPDQAARRMVETTAQYERDKEQGFTYRPREHRAACDEMGDCPHDPKWGVPPVPTLDGYVWSVVHCLGSRPKYKHLVSMEHVERVKARDYSALDEKPLCGGKAAYHWRTEDHVMFGKVPCKRCTTAAERLLERAS